ncbi:ankyrin repeat domain-containing protein [Candidatus Parcubacteria bacterium]|nr:MAG: ankyrin repeat domain-containing protein [Candidatus Parcubacteria bacterium]
MAKTAESNLKADFEHSLKKFFTTGDLYDIKIVLNETGTDAFIGFLNANHRLANEAGINGQTLLMAFVKIGNCRIVKTLLELGADPNAMCYAAAVVDEVKMLLPQRRFAVSALSTAAVSQNFEMAEILMNHKADINYLDDSKRTALTLAVLAGSVSEVRFLLKLGANSDLLDENGKTLTEIAEDKINFEKRQNSVMHPACIKYAPDEILRLRRTIENIREALNLVLKKQ